MMKKIEKMSLKELIALGMFVGVLPWLVIFFVVGYQQDLTSELRSYFFIKYFLPLTMLGLILGILTPIAYHFLKKKHKDLAESFLGIILFLYFWLIISTYLVFSFQSWLNNAIRTDW